MTFIKHVPQDSAEFRRQLGQYAKRPDGVTLPLDVIRQARLPEHLCPLKRFAYLLATTRLHDVAPQRARLMQEPYSAHEVITAIYNELLKARNRQGVYEQIA